MAGVDAQEHRLHLEDLKSRRTHLPKRLHVKQIATRRQCLVLRDSLLEVTKESSRHTSEI